MLHGGLALAAVELLRLLRLGVRHGRLARGGHGVRAVERRHLQHRRDRPVPHGRLAHGYLGLAEDGPVVILGGPTAFLELRLDVRVEPERLGKEGRVVRELREHRYPHLRELQLALVGV